ncbi:dTDP-4-dehydrorhamnose reductase [Photobacterium marinum]|uniref:dTDP-4-dehydrorhamnose reductase n=1 Tax=Photobacterium marinum TaxID=1056511 RepID=L8JA20_9GAMM|nr:dTDP-4-dehydrorhamnose reductase [Photobacterium marinum]ELR65073.1 dTDP-4-dehydrorhamnose reductase [Photobacterium marinum]
MRVLITGSNGQLGHCLVKKLNSKFELLAVDRDNLNIIDKKAVENLVSTFKPQIIINCAAYTAVDKAEVEKKIVYEINESGVKNLAIAAENIDAALIQLSTDYVYDGNKKGIHSESSITKPSSIYGKSKLAGEEQAQINCKKHLIIRTSWLFDEYGNNFVKTMMRIARERKTLEIVNDQFGAPTYCKDLAVLIERILELIVQNRKIDWGIYNYSGSPYTNWHEFAEYIFEEAFSNKIITVKPKLIPVTSSKYQCLAKRPLNSKLDCSKAEKNFGIKPSDWKKALKNIKDFIHIEE